MYILCRCSKAEDVDSHSLAERAQLRRDVDEEEARLNASFFGVYQTVGALTAFAVLALTFWTATLGSGALPVFVLSSAVILACCSLLICVIGYCLGRYHHAPGAYHM